MIKSTRFVTVLSFSVLSLLMSFLTACQPALLAPSEGVKPTEEALLEEDSSRGVVAPGAEVHHNGDFTHVRLSHAIPFFYAVSGMSISYSDFVVKVRNYGTVSSRRVFIHYTTGGAWQDLELTTKTGYTNHTVFSGRLSSINTLRFAVRYETSAGTWWDNNRGADYWIQPWTSSGQYRPGVVGGGISVLSATTERVTFGGGGYGWRVKGQAVIDLNTFPSGFPSGAGIRIQNTPGSTGITGWDNYWHFNFLYAMTSATNLRVFSFESDPVDQVSGGTIPLPQPTRLRYVLFGYRNVGSTAHVYWDNNFGMDYFNNKVDGAGWY